METARKRFRDEIIDSLIKSHPSLTQCEEGLSCARDIMVDAFKEGKKLLVCGNGGSAADSEHIVGELMKSFRFKRAVDCQFREEYRNENKTDVPDWLEGALPAISLVSQTALSTAFCNDESAVGVFAQQVYGYGVEGDVLLAISTSGESQNVIEAAKIARAKHMYVISLTGAAKSQLSALSDAAIHAPCDEVHKIQEIHLPIYHALCASIEAELFEDSRA